VASWSLSLALLVAVIAAVTDHARRIIPNWLTLPPLAVALFVHAWNGGLLAGAWALAGALGCFAPAYFLFTRGALGGGDVKLFGALGALLGLHAGLEVEVAAFATVTAFALLTRAYHGGLLAFLHSSLRASLHLVAPRRFSAPEEAGASAELPMGGAILLAVLALAVRSLS
jgi:prepilin peptidase CpaA